jgi:hypothetical protein
MEATDDLSSEPHRGWGVLPRIRAPLARYPDGGGRLTLVVATAYTSGVRDDEVGDQGVAPEF